MIVKAYGSFENCAVYRDKDGIYCESKIFETVEFGYNKIVVERPLRDENGEIILKKGKVVADASLRDTENVPLTQDIDRYFEREVLPYAEDAWIDKKKTKVGYEIPREWKVRKGKTLYSIQTGKLDVNAGSSEGEFPFFTCSMYPKKIDWFSFDCEALLVAGNGVVGFTQYYNGKFNAYQRTYVLSKFINVDPQYLKHYVANLLPDAVGPGSVGSVISFIKLRDLQNFYVAMPDVAKQREISAFLDGKVGEIDSAMVKIKEVIEEYKKLKQSVITQAVTKRIRDNREMKDSRSVWLGQIPSDWDMRKIKYIFKIQKDIAGEEGHMVLSITQKGIKPKDLSKNEGQLAENYSNYQLVHIGDFAMNHMDLLTGWVDISQYEGVTSPDLGCFG